MRTAYRPLLLACALVAMGYSSGGWSTARAAAWTAPPGGAIFSASGNGIANTRRFHVPATWKIVYSFSHCQIPGLSIYVKGDQNDLTSDERNSGSGVQYEYGGGSVYLSLNTACNWHVTVYSGRWVVNGRGLRIAGNGITNTIAFRVPSEWQIHYSFWNCSISGFSIYLHGDADDIMSREGKRGSGVQYEHSGGIVWLAINTACFWQVKISG